MALNTERQIQSIVKRSTYPCVYFVALLSSLKMKRNRIIKGDTLLTALDLNQFASPVQKEHWAEQVKAYISFIVANPGRGYVYAGEHVLIPRAVSLKDLLTV